MPVVGYNNGHAMSFVSHGNNGQSMSVVGYNNNGSKLFQARPVVKRKNYVDRFALPHTAPCTTVQCPYRNLKHNSIRRVCMNMGKGMHGRAR